METRRPTGGAGGVQGRWLLFERLRWVVAAVPSLARRPAARPTLQDPETPAPSRFTRRRARGTFPPRFCPFAAATWYRGSLISMGVCRFAGTA